MPKQPEADLSALDDLDDLEGLDLPDVEAPPRAPAPAPAPPAPAAALALTPPVAAAALTNGAASPTFDTEDARGSTSPAVPLDAVKQKKKNVGENDKLRRVVIQMMIFD